MKTSLSRQISQPQLGPYGPAQIIKGPCPDGQAHLNGLCRDIPNAGLTKCGVVKIEYNNYMMFENHRRPEGLPCDPYTKILLTTMKKQKIFPLRYFGPKPKKK